MDRQRPRFEVADVVRRHEAAYRLQHAPSGAQERVLRNIAACRTAALGGHVDACSRCSRERISYNSCRDRHCPKCQAPRRAKWLAERIERILPTPYFHVVFTVPEDLHPLALRNKAVIYRLLFEAASRTLLTIARDRRHLGAEIGVTAVLHTWGQNLLLHPHLHCVVTGGGLSLDGRRWRPSRPTFLAPVRVLSALFRGKFLAGLQHAYDAGELELRGSTAHLSDALAWAALRDELYRKSWVVYAKPPFGGPQHVFRYLGRYTHRVAISNQRLLDVGDDGVTFALKDYRNRAKKTRMTLTGAEFLRRFLLHVLPKGFVRIRHYGLCASRNVHSKLETARRLLRGPSIRSASASSTQASPWWERFLHLTGVDVMACSCGGRLMPIRSLPATLHHAATPARASPVAA